MRRLRARRLAIAHNSPSPGVGTRKQLWLPCVTFFLRILLLRIHGGKSSARLAFIQDPNTLSLCHKEHMTQNKSRSPFLMFLLLWIFLRFPVYLSTVQLFWESSFLNITFRVDVYSTFTVFSYLPMRYLHCYMRIQWTQAVRLNLLWINITCHLFSWKYSFMSAWKVVFGIGNFFFFRSFF